MKRSTRAAALCFALLTATALLSACVSSQPGAEDQTTYPEEASAVDDWVVVTFGDTEARFDLNVMDALLETELAADEALQAAGAGFIDGNEIGDNRYDLFFIGTDRNAMWNILQPIFDEAPVHWTTVELRDGLEDSQPIVLSGSDK